MVHSGGGGESIAAPAWELDGGRGEAFAREPGRSLAGGGEAPAGHKKKPLAGPIEPLVTPGDRWGGPWGWGSLAFSWLLDWT